MRVLFTSTPGWGHVNPMIPLARAFADRGDEVLWATAGEVRPALEATGLPTAPAGLAQAEIAREFNRRVPDAFLAGVRARLSDAHGTSGPRPSIHEAGVLFGCQFGTVAAPAMLSDLLSLVRDWQPSLLIHEASEFAGPIAAAAVGIPGVTHSHGRLLPVDFVAEARAAVAPLWEREGFEPRGRDGSYDGLYLDICPPGLQPPDTERVSARQALRPGSVAAQASDEDLPALVQEKSQRPLVFVTFGTVVDQDLSLLSRVVEALRGLDARVLATTGPGRDPAVLGNQPANVEVRCSVAPERVLPECAAVVSHGGSATILGGLAHGLPQLCLPLAADQFVVAAACEKAGIGLALRGGASSGEEIKAAAERVLSDPAFRSCAAHLADEIARMTPPEEVARILGGGVASEPAMASGPLRRSRR